jgi:hypothetical protein
MTKTMTAKAPVVAVRTNKLNANDEVQFGNIFHGFEYATVVAVTEIANRPYSRHVHVRFNHGNVAVLTYGVGATWYVVQAGA